MTTTRLWLHRIPKEIEALEGDLRDFIREVPGLQEADRSALLGDARFQIHQTASLVFTGQYSSGKSMLIKAITDGAADVVTDADISTDDVTEHRWGDVLLIDTPGVKAGVQRHDELAERALASADLIVFAVTGHGFDDTLARHAAYVADQLGKLDQMVVVWTQKSKFMPDAPVRLEHLRAALGPGADQVPVVCTDAKWYLDAIGDPAGSLSARKLQASGINDLRAALNELSINRGDLARYRQPLQSMQVVLAAVETGLVEDKTERIALDMLSRQEKAVVRQQDLLATATADARRQFEDDCLRQTGFYADAIDLLDAAEPQDAAQAAADAEQNLRAGLDDAARRYGERLNAEVQRAIRSLTSELDDIRTGPQARHLANLGIINLDDTGAQPRSTRFTRLRQPPPPPDWAKDLAGHTNKMQGLWGAGAGAKASAGSMGHKIVLNVGHVFDHKFKPWQAVRIADNIGKIMKVAGPAILVGSVAYEIYAQERSERRFEEARQVRRNGLREAIRAQARSIADTAEAQLRGEVGGPLQQVMNEIEQARRDVMATQHARAAAHHKIADLRHRIARAMVTLTPGDEPSP